MQPTGPGDATRTTPGPGSRPGTRTLRRYVRREVAMYALVGLLLFTFVIFMQDLGRVLEVMVSAGSWSLLALVAYVVPQALVFTLPMAVLVGLLIGLGRLGVDNELTALRACGLGARRQVAPLLEIAVGALGLALAMTLWLAPAAQRRLRALTAQWASAAITAAVQPRVFFDPGNNPDWMLYAGDVTNGGRSWRQVLVADMRHRNQPELTMAAAGTLVYRGPGAVQLHLVRGTQYTVTNQHPEDSLISAFQTVDIPLSLPLHATPDTALSALPSNTLWHAARYGRNWLAARVEMYRRWALAFACLALAMLGAPLGLRGGRGGKAGGFVLTLMLVLGYYLVFILGIGLAQEGKLPPFVGVWGANLICFAWGLWAILRLDRIPRRPVEGTDPVAWVRAALSRRRRSSPPAGMPRRRWMPSLIEGYVIREFLGYTGLLLAAFLSLILVFTLFTLIGNVLQHHIGMGLVVEYLLYLSPQMLYLTIPLAILVGVLVTFGLMSKANEITALRASGVSAYRLLAPVLAAAFALCTVQFALGATWLPSFNQKQDALHARIQGQPPRSYRNPERKWIFGQRNDIYYFRFYDPQRQEFADISVFEFDPQRFQLTRRIFAREANWDPAISGWVFADGWVRTMAGDGTQTFQRFRIESFPSLSEQPAYFATDAREGSQMSYGQLRRYIASLRSSGYDVARLSVTLARKIAYPLTTVIMALLAFPFALTVGRRGAVAGITVAIVVAITYWSSAGLLQALGNLNQLPPLLAAWTPDVLFLGAGIYLLLRMPT